MIAIVEVDSGFGSRFGSAGFESVFGLGCGSGFGWEFWLGVGFVSVFRFGFGL